MRVVRGSEKGMVKGTVNVGREEGRGEPEKMRVPVWVEVAEFREERAEARGSRGAVGLLVSF